MVTDIDTEDLTRLNQSYFNDLVGSVTELGFVLSPNDVDQLRKFYDQGAARLRQNAAIENYEDLLSYATGQLVNRFSFSSPAELLRFDSFRDFLRSFCPLDPWC